MEKQLVPTIENLIAPDRFSPDEVQRIKRAFEFASEAHRNQRRLSGEPFIIHPLNVTKILLDMGFDATVVIAGLLHDTVEDTGVTLRRIREEFGEEVAGLVDGVTKISKIRSENIKQRQAENIRKMLLSMVNDVRIILIKLADKLHNMRTLEYLDRQKAQQVARETLEIYAPLAGRLGMARVKVELEDLALKCLEPEFYEDLKNYVVQTKESRERYIKKVKQMLHREFTQYRIHSVIYGRAKHFYSIYRKMKEKEKSFDEIFDLFAIRIITKSVRNCYEVLGVVHKLWMPVRGRFKDYIAMPKANMYQSLHTTVVGPEGKTLEVQIRTDSMDLIAEEGIAAHWAYKEGAKLDNLQKELKWLKKLRSWKENLDNPAGFMEDLQKDLLVEEIYVFTPKGDVVELPIGSTPIDFAYKIHTEIGHHCIGAKVNGRMVPLRKPLHSCEVVEILTSKNATPSREWLDVVKTSKARHKIRAFFSRVEGVRLEVLKEDFKPVVQGKAPAGRKTKDAGSVTGVKESPVDYQLVADGEKNVQINLGRCCSPHPGDEIVGYITRGKGVTVHRVTCKNLRAIKDWQSRMISVEWEEKSKKMYTLSIISRDRSGLLMDISTAIASFNANITELHLKSEHGAQVRISCRVQVTDEQQLRLIVNNLQSIPDVISLEYC
ncbi:MAG: RelA/SpoT family protein [Spirochaetota bacterium]